MHFSKKILFTAIATAFVASCGSDNDDPAPKPQNSSSQTTSSTAQSSSTASSSSEANASCPNNVCTISGNITEDMTLSADYTWVLNGIVTVGEGNVNLADQAAVDAVKAAGVTLEIEAGTEIKATDDAALIITRGSKIMAEGTAIAPITFSSAVDDDYDGEGEWGGVIIQGLAPQYGVGGTGACFGTGTVCNIPGEGGSDVAFYGGNDPADDSGVMRYVRIAEGGYVSGPNNEINGLTLQGVGHSTQIEYIQVHGNLDDGIEWFGGTVNVKYAVLTNNDDDDIDFDEGYQGNIQHVIIRKHADKAAPTGSNDPRGIEANSSSPDQAPETNAVLSNITIIGSDLVLGDNKQPGMRLRGDVNTNIWNSAVSGYGDCVRIDSGDNVFVNFIGSCDESFWDDKTSGASITATNATDVAGGQLEFDDLLAIMNMEARLDAPVTNITAVDNGSGFIFDVTDYVGAVNPDAMASDRDWYSEWIIPGSLVAPTQEIKTPEAADFVTCTGTVCTIGGVIDEDYTMTFGTTWVLNGFTQVGAGNVNVADQAQVDAIIAAGVTLTIEPGVHVRATDDAALVVTRGSKLMAEGTFSKPITFSSATDDDFDGEGEWGGVILQGFAPQYGVGGTGPCYGAGVVCNIPGEGSSDVAFYGGNNPADNSGAMKYVRIAEGGYVAGPNNEINGLTLQGVGHQTSLSYIQVHGNLDDGIEWFGGTVNLKYAVLTNNDDDDIDFDEGYQGNIQHVLIRKHPNKAAPTGSNDPRGVEANSSSPDQVPETNATLANFTILGSDLVTGANSQPALRLRGDVNTRIWNSAVSGYGDCIRIDSGDNVFMNFIGACLGDFLDDNTMGASITSTGLTEVSGGALTFDSKWAVTNAEASLASGVTDFAAVDNGSNFTFDATDYVGAVDPSAATAWWEGWTIEGSLAQ